MLLLSLLCAAVTSTSTAGSLSPKGQTMLPPPPGTWIEARGGADRLRVFGLVQADALFAPPELAGPAARFEIRRARLAIKGRLARHYGFRVEPQFTPGGVALLEAYAAAELSPLLRLRLGSVKTPLGIEMLQPITSLLLPERGLSTQMVPIRDIGLELAGESGGLGYTLMLGDGVVDGRRTDGNPDGKLEVYGRVWIDPLALAGGEGGASGPLRLGFAGSYGRTQGSAEQSELPGYQSDARQSLVRAAEGAFAQGRRLRLNPQLSAFAGPFGVLAEYLYAEHGGRTADDQAERWTSQSISAVATWVFGGRAQFGPPAIHAEAGAAQFSLRYGWLAVDAGRLTADDAATHVHEGGAALSWWPDPAVRASLAYTLTQAQRPGGRTRGHAVLLRAQLGI